MEVGMCLNNSCIHLPEKAAGRFENANSCLDDGHRWSTLDMLLDPLPQPITEGPGGPSDVNCHIAKVRCRVL
jgi:hypothetical protein